MLSNNDLFSLNYFDLRFHCDNVAPASLCKSGHLTVRLWKLFEIRNPDT